MPRHFRAREGRPAVSSSPARVLKHKQLLQSYENLWMYERYGTPMADPHSAYLVVPLGKQINIRAVLRYCAITLR